MDHSILIPTYNRPANLGRLLRYFERSGLDLPVLVLDSSTDDQKAENRAVVRKSALEVEIHEFDSALHPFEKMREGLTHVKTAYCSACADDDLIFVPALRQMNEALRETASLAAVHGGYLNFREEEDVFRIASVEQSYAHSVSPSALARMSDFLKNYNVLFYAVYRTEVMKACFAPMARIRTTLLREIASSALAVANGPVARLDTFYMARNTDDSASYDSWHPHQIIASETKTLFEDYASFRELLVETIDRQDQEAGRDTGALIDLMCLRYLGPFLRADVLDFIVEQKMTLGHDSRTTIDNLWKTFVATPNRTQHRQVPLFQDDSWTFAPGVLHPNAPRQDYLVTGRGPDQNRTYFLNNEFFFPGGSQICSVGRADTEFILEELDKY